MEREEGDIYWVHASPYKPQAWYYLTSKVAGKRNFKNFKTSTCFVGHSHKPIILEQTLDGGVNEYIADTWIIEPGNRYIFNDGSLGQPRDGNPNPTFMFYDSEKKIVKTHRFKYNLDSTKDKIRNSGLPSNLAERLSQGR